MQGSDTWAYTFDLANRLTQVKKNNVTIGTYAYDANGIRAKKVENGATTHYLALGYKVMYEKTGAVGTHHIFAGSQRIAEVRGPTTSYFHNDHLGSPRVVTDASGVPGLPMATKPFGEPHVGSAQTSYGFTGKDLDSTGLYYFAARYYDASVGRFISEDSYAGDLLVPLSQNRYIYVGNNPLVLVDPSGESWILAGAIIGGAAASALHYHFSTPAEARSLGGYLAAAGGGALTGVGLVLNPLATAYAMATGVYAGFLAHFTHAAPDQRTFAGLANSMIRGSVFYGAIAGLAEGLNHVQQNIHFRNADAHYQKHGKEIAGLLGEKNYTMEQYVKDARHVVQNGTYIPESNAYIRLIDGTGKHAKFAFVGLDRMTGEITTFHIKDVPALMQKAPDFIQ